MQPLKQEDPRALKLVPDGEPIVSLSLTKRERLAVANYNGIPAGFDKEKLAKEQFDFDY